MRGRGLSLLEVIFAGALLSLTFMAILNIVPTSVIGEKRSQNKVVADALAQSRLERARAIPFNQLVADGVDHPVDPPGAVYNRTAFRITERIEDASPTGRLKRVSVTVTWNDPGFQGNSGRTLTAEALVVHVRK